LLGVWAIPSVAKLTVRGEEARGPDEDEKSESEHDSRHNKLVSDGLTGECEGEDTEHQGSDSKAKSNPPKQSLAIHRFSGFDRNA